MDSQKLANKTKRTSNKTNELRTKHTSYNISSEKSRAFAHNLKILHEICASPTDARVCRNQMIVSTPDEFELVSSQSQNLSPKSSYQYEWIRQPAQMQIYRGRHI